MKTLITITAIFLLCAIFCQGQTIMPMPIPISSGGGKIPPNVPLAGYLSLMILLIFCLLVRFLVVRKSEHFKKQSIFKNFFYELDEYSFAKPSLNFWIQFIILLNMLAFLFIMMNLFMDVLE